MVEILKNLCVEYGRVIRLASAVLLAFVFLLGVNFVSFSKNGDFATYFLNVGQGDSQFLVFPNDVQLLIDGGKPNSLALQQISEIMSPQDRVIELIALTHPQLDHFGGLIETMKRYRVGVFLWNGRETDGVAFEELRRVIKEKNIKEVLLRKGDRIIYGDYTINVVWPEELYVDTKDANDGSLVLEVSAPYGRMLFTGDIGEKIEKKILSFYKSRVDILKVPHHGSKYSSSEEFIKTLKPKVAVIGVGKNSYGHPTEDVLSRLAATGAQTFRTDRDGVVSAVFEGGLIRIFHSLGVE